MGVPAIPLSELYRSAIDYVESRGGHVDLSSAPESFQWSDKAQQWTVATSSESFTCDAVVLALAFEGLGKLLPALPRSPEADQLAMSLGPVSYTHLYSAVLVDMEAATVARFALSRHIPFFCLKAISDEIADVLPDFGCYTGSDGHVRVGALLGHVVIRPKYWPAMLRIGHNTKTGAQAIAGALRPFMGGA